LDSARTNNKWPLAREGLPFVLVGTTGTLLLAYWQMPFAAILGGILTFFTACFFRDPERKIPGQPNAVLAPADGKILKIEQLPSENNPLGQRAIKISIFMSVFNVHVNRIPAGGHIRQITYRPGKFFSANRDKASVYNESNSITLETSNRRRIVLVQIAGFVARRIVCWIEEGDQLEAGQRVGLIRFGSRADVYLPFDMQVAARPGQKVKAGQTVVGYFT
jgi:phosphatidylserine decarboxylase